MINETEAMHGPPIEQEHNEILELADHNYNEGDGDLISVPKIQIKRTGKDSNQNLLSRNKDQLGCGISSGVSSYSSRGSFHMIGSTL